MPYGLDTHVLTVDANVIHKVDTGNLENLFSMWTVFSKCADSVEQGRRLENLSWRLWQREQFCCDTEKPSVTSTSTSTQSPPRDIPSDRSQDDVPQLSGSVDSVVDEEAVEFTSISAPLDITRPLIRRQDSTASTRSRRDRHITADDFEKMVVSIIHTKEPLSAPVTSAAATTTTTTTTTQPAVTKPTSTQAESSSGSSGIRESDSNQQYSSIDTTSPHITPHTKIVHGFSPSPVPVYITAPVFGPAPATMSVIPEPQAAPAAKLVQPKKQPAKFALGGSCSSSEPDDATHKTMYNKACPAAGSRPSSLVSAQRKQASFNNKVSLLTYDISEEAAVDDSETDDDVDESAIEDDESSDWEDSVEESGKSSIDDAVFKRDNFKIALASRSSLITLMIEKNERAHALASQSTPALRQQRPPTNVPTASSPNDSDDGGLVMKRAGRQSLLKPINEGARTKAQPIIAPPQHEFAHAAMSPRTTRMKMLHTELTASLRMGLVRERQQKTATINAVLKRRHTSQDVANLKQYPVKACMKQEEDANADTFNNFLIKDTFNGYHDKGW